MCPVTLAGVSAATYIAAAGLAVSAAAAGTSIYAQKQQADAQAKYQEDLAAQREQQIQENYDRVMESYRLQTVAEQVRMDEVRKAASQQLFNINQAGLARRAAASAEAASSGRAGQSTYTNLLTYLTQTGQGNTAILSQYGAAEDQSARNQQAFHIQARNRVASIQPYVPSPIEGVNYAATFLQLGQQAVGTIGTAQNRQAQLQALTQTPALQGLGSSGAAAP